MEIKTKYNLGDEVWIIDETGEEPCSFCDNETYCYDDDWVECPECGDSGTVKSDKKPFTISGIGVEINSENEIIQECYKVSKDGHDYCGYYEISELSSSLEEAEEKIGK